MTNLAKGAPPVGADVLTELEQRLVCSGDDRMEWLLARQSHITASEIGRLRAGGAGARREIVSGKFETPVEISGNRYIDRGHARETWIGEWVAARFPGFRANTALYRARENESHGATPDLVGVRNGELVIGEIKTSKYDLDPLNPRSHYHSTPYAAQQQWQMYVCGASRCLFVWEQHDDNWPNPQPVDLEPGAVWIERDDAEISRLVALADRALADVALERSRREGGSAVVPELDGEIDGLALAVLSARVEQKAVEARVKAPWNRLLALLESHDSFSQTGLARVTWTNETTTETVPDEAAALAAANSEGLTGAQLREAADEARSRWEAHRAAFTTTREKSVRKLTVTEPKADR